MVMFRRWRKSVSNSRIWACTVTSRAVVGSSANSSLGLHDIAIAIMIRWRIPPESWLGNLRSICFGSGMRTRVSNSMLRARASLRLIPSRTRRLSCSCEPILRTGLSAVIGSWKIMAMPVPNSLRTSSRDISESTLPSKVMRPSRVTLLPVSRPIAARDITVFPEPDSPTMPMLVPA